MNCIICSSSTGSTLPSYQTRWTIETTFAEIKTTLKGVDVVLRSKTPELVRQEFWGLLLAHHAVRKLMLEAALVHEHPPDTLSFKHSLNIMRRKLPKQRGALPPRAAPKVVAYVGSVHSRWNTDQSQGTIQPP